MNKHADRPAAKRPGGWADRFRSFACCWLACALALCATAAGAATCSVTASTLAFGTYNPLTGTPLDSTTTINVSCTKGAPSSETVNYTIALSTGSGSYVTRTMSSGAQVMNYNLYTTTGRTTVWGNGTGATVTISNSFSLTNGSPTQNRNHTVFGRVPNGQDVGAGSYVTGTPITVTVTY